MTGRRRGAGMGAQPKRAGTPTSGDSARKTRDARRAKQDNAARPPPGPVLFGHPFELEHVIELLEEHADGIAALTTPLNAKTIADLRGDGPLPYLERELERLMGVLGRRPMGRYGLDRRRQATAEAWSAVRDCEFPNAAENVRIVELLREIHSLELHEAFTAQRDAARVLLAQRERLRPELSELRLSRERADEDRRTALVAARAEKSKKHTAAVELVRGYCQALREGFDPVPPCEPWIGERSTDLLQNKSWTAMIKRQLARAHKAKLTDRHVRNLCDEAGFPKAFRKPRKN